MTLLPTSPRYALKNENAFFNLAGRSRLFFRDRAGQSSVGTHTRWGEGTGQLADLCGKLCRAPLFHARATQAREHRAIETRVGLPIARSRQMGSHATGGGWRDLSQRTAEYHHRD